jgi:hypothetical protein
MFAGLWPLVWHYGLFSLLIGGFIAIAILSVALEIELAKIPLIGGWLARNVIHIREWAILAAVLTASHVIIYGIGVSNGEVRIKAQWAAAEKVAIERAKAARSSAVTTVKRHPDGLRNDPNDRDN